MTAVRAVLIAAGLMVVGYGALLVLDLSLRTIILIGIWGAAGVIVHDFVFAPISAAFGWTGRRLIGGRWWTPVTVAGLCSAVLVLLAIPVFSKPGLKPDNSTALDRNYPLGLAISLAVVWACVPLYYLVVRWLPTREAEVEATKRSNSE